MFGEEALQVEEESRMTVSATALQGKQLQFEGLGDGLPEGNGKGHLGDVAVAENKALPCSAVVRSDGATDEEWNFAGQDTQYSTHGLHTYVAAMIPGLARKLIDTYVPAGGIVNDPFCGGGAVMVEAIRSGRTAVGTDINDLAVLISQAKTRYLSSQLVEDTTRSVVSDAKAYNGPALQFPASARVEFWFKDYMLQPLTGLKLAIDDIPSEPLRTLFRVVFSHTVRSVSLTYRNEVRLRRMSEEEQTKFNPDVFDMFSKFAALARERVAELPVGARADIGKQDVRKLTFANDLFDAIICSPPYGDERNGVNYTQFAKNMLYWLGCTQSELKTSKNMTLGWGKTARLVPPSTTLARVLDIIADNPTAVWEAIAFYGDYYEALREMARVVRGRVIIVIGNRVLHRTIIDNPQITVEFMDALGVPLERIHFRSLPTKRLPKMREFGAAIDKEAILVFRK